MEIAFLLHLYQPATQSESIFRRVYEESYGPLIKRISKLKNFKVSLNVPLSLLEQMDRYGYGSWIKDLRDLVRSGRVEIVGTAAYHPILPKLPKPMIERQVILNEYGLGYYFGEHKNLEGEEAAMIKDVTGFFPPELSVSERVVLALEDLGYKWMLIDEASIPLDLNRSHKHGVYSYKDYSIKLVCRNRAFSNAISFKRDADCTELVDLMRFTEANVASFVTAFDGEFFGHHFDGGFAILDSLLAAGRNMGISFVTVSEYVANASAESLDELIESSWGASDQELAEGNPYPMWDAPGNELHACLWHLVNLLIERNGAAGPWGDMEEGKVVPLWLPEGLSEIYDATMRKRLARDILLDKSLHSDQFWWASKRMMPAGEYLYSEDMIRRALKVLKGLAELYEDEQFFKNISEKVLEVEDLLAKEGR